MFGLGITEILLLAVVGVLFWGPEKIPEVACTLSKALSPAEKVYKRCKIET